MSDFFKTPTHRLTVFHPTLCTKKKFLAKGIESLQQTQIFQSLYLSNLMVYILNISNLDYKLWQN